MMSRDQTPEAKPFVDILHKLAVQNSPDLLSIVDSDYVYRFVNKAYLKRYDRAKNEILGRHASEVLGKKAFEDSVKPNFDKCLSGKEVRYQGWFAYPNIGKRYMDVFYYPVRIDDGSVKYVNVTVRDITDLKQHEDSLAKSENMFRSLVNLMSDSVYELDESLKYTYMHSQVSNVTGYKPEDHYGKTPFDFMPPNEASRLEELAKERLKSPQPLKGIENIVRHKNGQMIFLETSAVPTYNTLGEFSGYLCIDRDITRRKRAELELKQREEHLRSIVETTQDGIAVFGIPEQITFANPALISMFGYINDEDIVGTPTHEFFSPDSLPVLEGIRERLDAGEEIHETIAFKAKRKDGSTFDAEVKIGNFTKDDEQLQVAVVRDMTSSKKMEAHLNQSRKLAAVGGLATGVAHEINNPVATIDVHAGIIREVMEDVRAEIDNSSLKKVNACLEIIEQQIDRCRSITDSLLNFTRIPQVGAKEFEINELLRKTARMVASLSLANSNVELYLDESLPPFWGNPNMLQQIFVVVLTNAFEATGDKDTITISTCISDDDDIEIEFKDSGHGISDDIRDQIFDPFFSTRPEGEGTGLGLSICYYIIKEMNGKIEVESSPGKGTTFTVILPGSNITRKGAPQYKKTI